MNRITFYDRERVQYFAHLLWKHAQAIPAGTYDNEDGRWYTLEAEVTNAVYAALNEIEVYGFPDGKEFTNVVFHDKTEGQI